MAIPHIGGTRAQELTRERLVLRNAHQQARRLPLFLLNTHETRPTGTKGTHHCLWHIWECWLLPKHKSGLWRWLIGQISLMVCLIWGLQVCVRPCSRRAVMCMLLRWTVWLLLRSCAYEQRDMARQLLRIIEGDG